MSPSPGTQGSAFGLAERSIDRYRELAQRPEFVGEGRIPPTLRREAESVLAELVEAGAEEFDAVRRETLQWRARELSTWLLRRSGVYRSADIRRPLLDVPVRYGYLPEPIPNFVGRESEIEQLVRFWDERAVRLVSLVGIGGIGKSTLVRHWLRRMEQDGFRGAARVFCWRFVDEGGPDPSVDRPPTRACDEFFAYALEWLGEPAALSGAANRWVERLLGRLRQGRSLLVLDGLENLQRLSPGEPAGAPTDSHLVELLNGLASDFDGMCVLTTRLPIAGLPRGPSVRKLQLARLPDADASDLLRQLGVKADPPVLARAVSALSGHPLTLKLFAGQLLRTRRGELSASDLEEGLLARKLTGTDALHSILDFYLVELRRGDEDAQRGLQLLQLLGLFDRPASLDELKALVEPPLPGLETGLAGAANIDQALHRGLEQVRALGLVQTLPDPMDPKRELADVSSLVRIFLADKLRERYPAAWREGNFRLFDSLVKRPKPNPESLDDLVPLYRAIMHGCRADRHEEAFSDVYWRRIQNNDSPDEHKRRFAWTQLGVFGMDLSALACFFEQPWTQVASALSPLSKARVLNAAGFVLRALLRIEEAIEATEASFAAYQVLGNSLGQSETARRLGELRLLQGEAIGGNAKTSQEFQLSLDFAERTEKRDAIRSGLARLGYAAFEGGDLPKALALFRRAEGMLREEDGCRYLYTYSGHQYFELLIWQGEALAEGWADSPQSAGWDEQALSDAQALGADAGDALTLAQARFEQVRERARETVQCARRIGRRLDIALNHLALGRALFLGQRWRSDAEHPDYQEAGTNLSAAVFYLRQAKQQHEIPKGLIARAVLRRALGNFDGAAEDLDEAWSIAESGLRTLQLDGSA